MALTKAFLERRLETLRADVLKVEANAYALRGAIADCEYLLANFDTPDEPARSPAPNGADLEALA